MEIVLTEKAIQEGYLRVWLRRVPEEAGVLFVVPANDAQAPPVGEASLYGRGRDSTAAGQTMLLFNLDRESEGENLSVGDAVKIVIEGPEEGQLMDIELDVILVE